MTLNTEICLLSILTFSVLNIKQVYFREHNYMSFLSGKMELSLYKCVDTKRVSMEWVLLLILYLLSLFSVFIFIYIIFWTVT